MANIRDVARRAGVSPTAVSFVLNGRHDQLSQETIERVERAMNELDYHPSAIAQGLATKRTGTIGVLVTHLRHPVLTFIVSALVAEARRQGRNVIISDEVIHAHAGESPERMVDEQITQMIKQRVDGVAAATPLPEAVLARLRRAGIPVVAFDRRVGGVDSVYADFARGARLAAAHLAALGRSRLLYIGSSDDMLVSGVAAGVAGSRLEVVDRLLDPARPAAVFEYVQAKLREGLHFDAVFVASDWLASGLYRALEAQGRRIPQDVAVVGFDDTFAEFYSPALTSVAQPFGEIGRTACRLLAERIDGDKRPPRDARLAPVLRVRESCGAVAVDKAALVQGVWERDLT